MYESFYGLSEHPFSLTPDPQFFFVTEDFKEAINRLIYAVNRREAISVVTGDVGTGKTLLCRVLLLRMAKNVRTALILNPILDVEDMLRAVIQDFGIKPGNRRTPYLESVEGGTNGLQDASWLEGLSKKQLLDELNRFLLEGALEEISNVLAIDEAQDISLEVLEQLRLLTNLESSKRKLLQIIFVGQLELDYKLNLPKLRQLKQRVAVRRSLRPLSKNDMVRYIYHRLWKAGGKQSLKFSKGALSIIYRHSGGYPRLINIICDRALLAGYNKRSKNITAAMVRTALAGLGRSKKIITQNSFKFSLKRVAVATVILGLIVGLSYWIKPRNLIGTLVDQLQPIALMPASINTSNSTIAEQLPPSSEPLEQRKVIPNSTPDNNIEREYRFSSEESERAENRGLTFLLQVHSMENPQLADSGLAALEQKGYPAFQRTVLNPDGTRWYVVYVGPFDDLETAQATSKTLLDQEQLVAILRSYVTPRN